MIKITTISFQIGFVLTKWKNPDTDAFELKKTKKKTTKMITYSLSEGSNMYLITNRWISI